MPSDFSDKGNRNRHKFAYFTPMEDYAKYGHRFHALMAGWFCLKQTHRSSCKT